MAMAYSVMAASVCSSLLLSWARLRMSGTSSWILATLEMWRTFLASGQRVQQAAVQVVLEQILAG